MSDGWKKFVQDFVEFYASFIVKKKGGKPTQVKPLQSCSLRHKIAAKGHNDSNERDGSTESNNKEENAKFSPFNSEIQVTYDCIIDIDYCVICKFQIIPR